MTEGGTLPGLVTELYKFSLEMVGLCVFIMFLYAGYLLMFGKKGPAIKVMQDAAIGLILLFSAYVILNSISTDLVNFKDPTTPPGPAGSAPNFNNVQSGGSSTADPNFVGPPAPPAPDPNFVGPPAP